MIYHQDESLTILQGDARNLAEVPDKSVHCIVTSPPYFGLRNYQVDGQIGLEPTLAEYVAAMCACADEWWRVLRDDGVMWFNIGDSYAGGKGKSAQAWSTENQDRDTLQKGQHQITGMGETRPTDDIAMLRDAGLKPKDLIGVPWRLAFAFQDRGWYLRSDIIWAKPNPMPESVTDRPTNRMSTSSC